MGRISPLVAAGLFAAASARPWEKRTYTNSTTPAMVYDFADIEPSEELTWVPCFDNPKISCANLLVPLDYNDISAGTTNMAWVKYVSLDESAEDIIFNPGGPGVSGVPYVVGGAEEMLANFGLQYNLISFEPRGVNNSGPALTCFPGAPDSRASYQPSSMTVPLPELYQSSKAEGEFCSEANANTTAKYGGTMATAQDIMYFLDKRHAGKTSSGNTTYGTSEEAKLWYYGISYGTALGQTLAALYPSRIGRMVLDGNVYGVQHYTGVLPSDVDDTDAAFHAFFSLCFEAGPDKCAFHGNSTSVEAIENRYLMLLQNLREAPAIQNTDDAPAIITDAILTSNIFSQLYQPMQSFPIIAQTLARLEQGIAVAAFQKGIEALGSAAQEEVSWSDNEDALKMITCIDAHQNFPIKTFEQYLDVREVYKKESYYAGANSASTNLLLCVGMDITPPESQQFPGFDPSGTTTAHPILFVNPIRDPITPLSSAHKMSALFPGSVVLAQDSTGHGVTTAQSKCTTAWLQQYMQQGTLPPVDTVCAADVKPFMDTPTKRAIGRRGLV